MHCRHLSIPLSLLVFLAQPVLAQSEAADHACAKQIQKHVTFSDSDSVKVVGVTGGKFEVIDYMDKRIAAVHFTVMANAKGEMGGYTGPRAYQCWTSEDRQRVLDYKPKRGP